MNSERYPYCVVVHGYVDGTRQRGRPRKRCLYNIREEWEVLGLVGERFANDELVWRSVVHILGCQRVATASSSCGR